MRLQSQSRYCVKASGNILQCPNKNTYGIPQGSPISGLLANVYMLEIDKTINNLVTDLNVHTFDNNTSQWFSFVLILFYRQK